MIHMNKLAGQCINAKNKVGKLFNVIFHVQITKYGKQKNSMYVNAFDCTLFHKFVKMTSDFHIRQDWQHCRLLQCGSQNSPVKVAALSRTAMWITEQPGEVHSKQTVRLWQLTVRCSTLCRCTNVNSITFYHQQHRHISVCYTINHAVNMLNKTASHKPNMVSRPLSALTQPVTQIHKQLNTETFFWQYKQNRCNLKN